MTSMFVTSVVSITSSRTFWESLISIECGNPKLQFTMTKPAYFICLSKLTAALHSARKIEVVQHCHYSGENHATYDSPEKN